MWLLTPDNDKREGKPTVLNKAFYDKSEEQLTVSNKAFKDKLVGSWSVVLPGILVGFGMLVTHL